MEADFSGYATKAGLKCSDGRTIMPKAFEHCDNITVPLVWQHGHSEATNVLGHAVLEARPDGVYAYGFFNETRQGQNAKSLVEHGDIKALSIYANQLVEKSKQVIHGMIREVSLVLAGANPGALIDFVNVAHADGFEVLEDEAIIYSGEEFEMGEFVSHADTSSTTLQDVYDSLDQEQKDVVHYMIGAAVEAALAPSDNTVQHSFTDTSRSNDSDSESRTTETSGNSSNSTVVNSDGSITQTSIDGNVRTTVIKYGDGSTKTIVADELTKYMTTTTTNANGVITHQEGPTDMRRNVFEKNGTDTADITQGQKHALSHEDVKGIVADAMRLGSLREAVEGYALKHGINDIDILFPDAKSITTTPDFDKRRTEWVSGVLGSTRHTPFSRVKTVVADLTQEEARAKGYIKGEFKREEWFGLTKRTTTPTTVYKKQKLDRDDIVDITDFDVVAWLKSEMRLMLEEEIARAILIGDGRDVSNVDKIKDPVGASDAAGIRSILNDHELFATQVFVNIDDANSSYDEVVDAVLDGMEYYKGTGTPDFYCTIKTLNMFLKAKDTLGRRLYPTKADVAAALNVANIIVVEPMNDLVDLVGIIVNLSDYNIGADKGGEVSLFDDFDIDYNQQKYLIETRLSGALTKIKSALVIKKVAASATLARPTKPTFTGGNTVTVPTITGVVYKNVATNATLTTGSPVTLTSGQTLNVTAVPAAGYYFPSSAYDWSFTYDV